MLTPNRERTIKKMKESNIEKYFVKAIKDLGGRAYKWVSPGNNGVPDRIVFVKGSVPIFVELKNEKGVLSKLQKVQIERLKKLGQDVRVLKGLEEVKRFIEELKSGI